MEWLSTMSLNTAQFTAQVNTHAVQAANDSCTRGYNCSSDALNTIPMRGSFQTAIVAQQLVKIIVAMDFKPHKVYSPLIINQRKYSCYPGARRPTYFLLRFLFLGGRVPGSMEESAGWSFSDDNKLNPKFHCSFDLQLSKPLQLIRPFCGDHWVSTGIPQEFNLPFCECSTTCLSLGEQSEPCSYVYVSGLITQLSSQFLLFQP